MLTDDKLINLGSVLTDSMRVFPNAAIRVAIGESGFRSALNYMRGTRRVTRIRQNIEDIMFSENLLHEGDMAKRQPWRWSWWGPGRNAFRAR